MSIRSGNLLLVIPAVLISTAKGIEIDEHFGHNLRAYLDAFEHVTVACPAMAGKPSNLVPLETISGHERCRVHVLPEPYREDRYLRNRRSVSDLLRTEIGVADYLLISPHSAFDWSTLATSIASEMGRDYNMEADWNLQDVVRQQLSVMPFGLQKLRKTAWHIFHSRQYFSALRNSRLALLQGAAVYEAYKSIAPNPHKVLNVQVTRQDRIDDAAWACKVEHVRSGATLKIVYAGRVISMKGPELWLAALAHAFDQGLNAQAVWVGEGDRLQAMRDEVSSRGLEDLITFKGGLEREAALKMVKEADIFLFCHLTDESPRCLVEALAGATPIVGFASKYACDLVSERGGGAFASMGNAKELSDTLLTLDRDRDGLVKLIEQARNTSLLYDREEAIQQRISLIRQYLRPRGSSAIH